jgi:hypothetical protein
MLVVWEAVAFENMNVLNSFTIHGAPLKNSLVSRNVITHFFILVCSLSDTLKEFFEAHFGEVAECNIMRDQVTKKSR